ncbi:DUF2817 domain-containing protein [bacterium]|nr:DUF2817 domain-containing protein [bacterium]
MELCGNKNGKILVIGCFHGDEPQGKYLIEKYLEQKPDTKLVFIPCLNEYGFKNNIRTNENGVDINRNFPTKNWGSTDVIGFYGGNAPASEVQTNFIIETVERIKPEVILTLHAPYKVVNYDGSAEKYAQKISEIIGYPVEPSIGYPTPGSFGTWAGVERNIPVITLELDEEIGLSKLEKPVFKIFEYLESL